LEREVPQPTPPLVRHDRPARSATRLVYRPRHYCRGYAVMPRGGRDIGCDMPDGTTVMNRARGEHTAAEGDQVVVAALAARAELACATAALCASYLDMLCRGIAPDVTARARVLQTEYARECAALVAAWQQGAGIAENMFVVETAARGFARIPGCDAATCALVEELLVDFIHEALLPASLRLLQ